MAISADCTGGGGFLPYQTSSQRLVDRLGLGLLDEPTALMVVKIQAESGPVTPAMIDEFLGRAMEMKLDGASVISANIAMDVEQI